MTQLTSKTREHIRALFEPGDVAQAEHLLISNCRPDQLALPPDHTELLNRIWFAALRVSHGGLSALAAAITLARTDWRDLLVVGGFADDVDAHLHWGCPTYPRQGSIVAKPWTESFGTSPTRTFQHP